MFAIGIRYMCGRAMAKHPSGHDRAEWPPHPDRLFMALVAAHFGSDGIDGGKDALVWLERQSPPSIKASRAGYRRPVTAFVPVNDEDGASVLPKDLKEAFKKSKIKVPVSATPPEYRLRKERQFPVAIPEDDTVYMIWQDANTSPDCRAALDRICTEVCYLGCSASLVQAWVEADPPEPNLMPNEKRGDYLRVPGQGRFDSLVKRYEAGLRPRMAMSVRYGKAFRETADPSFSVFDDNVVILREVGGDHFNARGTLRLAEALRGAVMGGGPQPPPEWVSGHADDGSASQKPHIAFVPLVDANHHGDGMVRGMAVVFPSEVLPEDRVPWMSIFAGNGEDGTPCTVSLVFGKDGQWILEHDSRPEGQRLCALRPYFWTGPASRWASVTPVVLDRYPKGATIAEDIIASACERIGLPKPVAVNVGPVSHHRGIPTAREFPAIKAKSGTGNRVHVHADIQFDEPVTGPVILGAGRFRGYGLCRPVFNGGEK